MHPTSHSSNPHRTDRSLLSAWFASAAHTRATSIVHRSDQVAHTFSAKLPGAGRGAGAPASKLVNHPLLYAHYTKATKGQPAWHANNDGEGACPAQTKPGPVHSRPAVAVAGKQPSVRHDCTGELGSTANNQQIHTMHLKIGHSSLTKEEDVKMTSMWVFPALHVRKLCQAGVANSATSCHSRARQLLANSLAATQQCAVQHSNVPYNN